MSVARTVLRNVASTWMGLASQLLVTFFLTPFVISRLGLEAYGVWLLLQSTVGYYGLVDMGLRAGLTQSITRRIARKDLEGVRRHLGAAIPLLAALGLVVVLLSFALSFILPWAVQMAPELSHGLWLIVFIQALSVAVQMPLAPHSAVLVGLERYDIANGVSIATRFLTALLAYGALLFDGGLIGICLSLLIANTIDSLLRYWIAVSLLPEIRGVHLSWDRGEFGEIANDGVWNFLIHVSRQLIYFSDALTVGFLFTAAAVAPFGIASALIDYGNRLVIVSTRVLFPTMANLREKNNHRALTLLYLSATRITLATSITILVIGGFWIAPFLKLWLGTDEQQQLIHANAPALFVALGIAFSFVSLQRAGTQLWLAENKLRSLALALFVEGVANLLLSLLLGWQFGLIGVAIGTAIPAAVMCFAVHLPMHRSILQMPYTEMLQQVLTRPIVYGLLLTASVYGLARWIQVGDSWAILFLAGILSTLAAAVCFGVVLSRQEMAFLRSKVFQLLGQTVRNFNVVIGRARHA